MNCLAIPSAWLFNVTFVAEACDRFYHALERSSHFVSISSSMYLFLGPPCHLLNVFLPLINQLKPFTAAQECKYIHTLTHFSLNMEGSLGTLPITLPNGKISPSSPSFSTISEWICSASTVCFGFTSTIPALTHLWTRSLFPLGQLAIGVRWGRGDGACISCLGLLKQNTTNWVAQINRNCALYKGVWPRVKMETGSSQWF